MNKWVTMVIGVLLGLLCGAVVAIFITSQIGASLDAVTVLIIWGLSVFCGAVLGYDFGESGTIGAPAHATHV